MSAKVSNPISTMTRPSLMNNPPVLTLYSKEAGAGSRHGWQESTTLVGAVSYLIVHAFEVVGPSRNLFRLIHSTQTKTRAKTFMHIPSTQFLCRTRGSPTLDSSGDVILSEVDWTGFRGLAGSPNHCQKLATAIRDLNTANRRGGRE